MQLIIPSFWVNYDLISKVAKYSLSNSEAVATVLLNFGLCVSLTCDSDRCVNLNDLETAVRCAFVFNKLSC